MKSDGKTEIFWGSERPNEFKKNRALEYCDIILLINCDIELSKLNELPLYKGTIFGNLVTAGV